VFISPLFPFATSAFSQPESGMPLEFGNWISALQFDRSEFEPPDTVEDARRDRQPRDHLE
jgi:hypothetical protein